MAWADLAISGAGSTCWELACMGLPAVTLVLAENQRAIAEQLNAAGLVLNLGGTKMSAPSASPPRWMVCFILLSGACA